jgi:hypothetical protein
MPVAPEKTIAVRPETGPAKVLQSPPVRHLTKPRYPAESAAESCSLSHHLPCIDGKEGQPAATRRPPCRFMGWMCHFALVLPVIAGIFTACAPGKIFGDLFAVYIIPHFHVPFEHGRAFSVHAGPP